MGVGRPAAGRSLVMDPSVVLVEASLGTARARSGRWVGHLSDYQ